MTRIADALSEPRRLILACGVLGLLAAAGLGVAVWAIIQNEQTRTEVQQIVKRVVSVEKPTDAQLRAGIAHALKVCLADAGCRGDVRVIGARGAQGQRGATGGRGPRGRTGARGPAGQQGERGPTGATGPTGSRGTQGATGHPGPQGPAGPQGPQGIPGVSPPPVAPPLVPPGLDKPKPPKVTP